jgi:AraC-type DNA-binding domain-containing proteins
MSICYYKIEGCNLLEIKKCQNELQAYKDHLHEELSIGFIQKGATNLNVNGKEYYIKAKEATVIYPFASHICQPVDLTNWEFTMIYINKDFYKNILDGMDEAHFMGIKKLNDEEYKKVNDMIATIKGNETLIEKEEKIISVLVDIFINCDINIDVVKDKQIEEIRKYIEINFLEQLKLDDIEMHFGLNKFGIIRSFKNRYNTTPAAYQLQLRVNYAKHLIMENRNLVQVALNSGFYDQAHFTKEFKKAYAITPKQYLKSIK